MEKQQLALYQKYIDILGIRQDISRPTIYSEAILKKVENVEIEIKDWEHLKKTFEDYSIRGKNYLNTNNYQDAIEELEIAHSLNPYDENTVLYLAQAHAGRWAAHRKLSDKRKTIQYAEQVLIIKPSNNKASQIIIELKTAAFIPWIPYKMWRSIASWVIFLGILGIGYWYYNKNKEAITAFFTKMTEKKGATLPDFDLRNISFETGSYELNWVAKNELDKMALNLKKRLNVIGEITTHTDNSGNPQINQQISEKRAQIIYRYLTSKGVHERQISYKGYGDTKPLFPNTSEDNMRKNRRVEFIIIKK